MYCTGLKSLVLPNSLTNLGVGAFMACYNIETLTVGTGLTMIPEDAFYYCDHLISLTLHKGIYSIGKWAFFGCDNVENIEYNGTQAHWNNMVIGEKSEYENGMDPTNKVLFLVSPSIN